MTVFWATALLMEATIASETSVNVYQLNNQEDGVFSNP
jgi:hypothetical protein